MFISADGGLGKSTLMREVAAAFDEETRDAAESSRPCSSSWTAGSRPCGSTSHRR
jgi:hypothetical protein